MAGLVHNETITDSLSQCHQSAIIAEPSKDIGHVAHDVPVDGNCFYSCILKTCGRMMKIGPKLNAISIQHLRDIVAHQFEHDQQTQISIKNLLKILRACPEMNPDEYQFIEMRDKSLKGFASLAAGVKKNGTWASEIENKVIGRILSQNFDVELVTLTCDSEFDLQNYCDIEEQLHVALKQSRYTRCVVLINIATKHYMYMSLNRDRTPLISEFLGYIRDYLNQNE